jgi:hypothetical protein
MAEAAAPSTATQLSLAVATQFQTMRCPHASFTMKTVIVLAVALSCVTAILAATVTTSSFSDQNCANLEQSQSFPTDVCSRSPIGSMRYSCTGRDLTYSTWNFPNEQCAGAVQSAIVLPNTCQQIMGRSGQMVSVKTTSTCSSGSSVTLALLSVTVAMLSMCM